MCGLLVNIVLWCVFFFKQKTAYEMRSSDWSSDVCSSDLRFTDPPDGVVVDVKSDTHPTNASSLRLFLLALRRHPQHFFHGGEAGGDQIGSASCRERVCQYV